LFRNGRSVVLELSSACADSIDGRQSGRESDDADSSRLFHWAKLLANNRFLG
jgi:hypothetical protein